jgi:hypothetical protein
MRYCPTYVVVVKLPDSKEGMHIYETSKMNPKKVSIPCSYRRIKPSSIDKSHLEFVSRLLI